MMYLIHALVHDYQFHKNELIINPEYFESASLGDIVQIFNSNDEKLLELSISCLEKVKGVGFLSIRLDLARAANVAPRQNLKINILKKNKE